MGCCDESATCWLAAATIFAIISTLSGYCNLNSIIYLVGVYCIAANVFPSVVQKINDIRSVEIHEKGYKKDVVYLYQFGGTATASSLSNFCIKVEAFCRLHNIKIERRNTVFGRGKNNLLPFVELNGEQIADSQIILRRISEHFKIEPYPNTQSAALGHAISRLLENHTLHLIVLAKREVFGKIVEAGAVGVPAFMLPIISSVYRCFIAKKEIGISTTAVGTFSEAERNELLRNDLIQLRNLLGKKQFLLGDEPTAVDCSALGLFGTSYYAIPSARFHLHDILESPEFAPLIEYLERSKKRIFGNEFCDKI